MAATRSAIGKSIVRGEGPDKVSGKAIYAADISQPGMLWGRVLRSPYPYARIVSIDKSQAEALPGVHAVVTGQDIPDTKIGRRMVDMPILARDVVRFVGEKVAAVAADDKDAAEADREAEFFTRMRPLSLIRRLIEADEVAAMTAYLASPLAAATNGAALRVEGGMVPTIA